MIRSDIRTYLLTKAALTALITGSDGNTHIYLSRIPQGNVSLINYPAVVYRMETGGHQHDLDGAAGYMAPVFEFCAIGTDPDVVESISEQLRQAMQGYRGVAGSITVKRLTLDDEYDDCIESKIGDDVGFYMTFSRYTIGFTESIPS